MRATDFESLVQIKALKIVTREEVVSTLTVWEPEKHPRAEKGSPTGGQFVPKDDLDPHKPSDPRQMSLPGMPEHKTWEPTEPTPKPEEEEWDEEPTEPEPEPEPEDEDGHERGQPGTIGPRDDDAPEQRKLAKLATMGTANKLGGGVNHTFLLNLPDGSQAVWKPSTGEAYVREGIPAGGQYIREVAAYDIAKIVGYDDLVPETTITQQKDRDGKLVFGSAQKFIKDADVGGSAVSLEDANRSILFDLVIGNTDRHRGNWLVEYREPGFKSPKLRLIDNGLTFSENNNDSLRSHLLGLFADVITDEDPIHESLKRPWKGKWLKIETALKRRGLSQAAIDSTRDRYDALMTPGTTWRDIDSSIRASWVSTRAR